MASIRSLVGLHDLAEKTITYSTEILGRGAFAKVYEARYNELPCAVKILHSIFKDDPGMGSLEERFNKECRYLERARHPNIVQYLGLCRNPLTQEPALLMELMDQSLTQFLKMSKDPLSRFTEVSICYDVALALAYLHSEGITHRDLSSNNVLLIGHRAKVSDFGISKVIDLNKQDITPLTKVPGTVVYMPPEALKDSPDYSEKLDCFSFGVLAIQIMTRLFPDPSPSTIEIPDDRSLTGKALIPVAETERRRNHIDLVDKSHPLLEIALNCLVFEKEDRPFARDLCLKLEPLKCVSTEPLKSIISTENVKAFGNLTKDTLSYECAELVKEKNVLSRECAELRRNKDTLSREKDVLSRERELLSCRKDALSHEKDVLSYEKDLLSHEKDLLSREKDTLSREKGSLSRDCAELHREKNRLEDEITRLQELYAPPVQGALPPPLQYTPPVQGALVAASPTPPSIISDWKTGSPAPFAVAQKYTPIITSHHILFCCFPRDDGPLYAYDYRSYSWSPLPAVPKVTIKINTVLPFLNSQGELEVLRCNDFFQLREGRWFRRGSINISETHKICILIAHEEFIIVLKEDKLMVCDMFSGLKKNIVKIDPASSVERATAAICNGVLYLVGVMSKGTWTSQVYKIPLNELMSKESRFKTLFVFESSPKVVTLQQTAPLPVCLSTCVNFKGHLLAVGGYSPTRGAHDEIYLYNEHKDEWLVIGKIPTARYQCLVGAVDDKLLVIGGWSAHESKCKIVESCTVNMSLPIGISAP